MEKQENKVLKITNIGLSDPTTERRSPDGVHPNFVLHFYKNKKPLSGLVVVIKKGESILVNKDEIDEITIKEQE